MRLFIAVSIEDSIKEKIVLVRKRLEQKIKRARVNWVDQDDLHLTVKFLGETDKIGLGSIKKAIRIASKESSAFSCRMSGLGCFPDIKNPRVIWAGCRDKTGTMIKIKKSLDDELSGCGFTIDKKEFIPHITIGRVKIVKGRDGFSEIENYSNKEFGISKVARIELMESKITSKGAIYSRIFYENI